MPSAPWTRAIIFLAAGIWFVAAFFIGVPVDRVWLKYLGGTASVVVILLLAFDLFIWRWLPKWLVKRPNIRGTWKATLQSNFIGQDGKPVEKVCYIVIRQNYSKICVEMLFDISNSVSASAEIVQGNGRPALWYTYRSEAHALKQEGNPPHRGATTLYIADTPRVALEGDYWTERNTTGRIETSGRNKKLADSFRGAGQLTYK